jgi:hypothetical protein
MAIPLQINVIVLGVDDLGRSIRFYTALGMRRCGGHHEEIAFFDAGGGLVLALFGRSALAEDAKLPDERAAFGGITIAFDVPDEAKVDALLEAAVKAGGQAPEEGRAGLLGRLFGLFRRSRRASLGDSPQPGVPTRRQGAAGDARLPPLGRPSSAAAAAGASLALRTPPPASLQF